MTVTLETINAGVEELVAKMFREAIQAEAARLVDAAVSAEPVEVVAPDPEPPSEVLPEPKYSPDMEIARNTILRKLHRHPGWTGASRVIRHDSASRTLVQEGIDTLAADGLIVIRDTTQYGRPGRQLRLSSEPEPKVTRQKDSIAEHQKERIAEHQCGGMTTYGRRCNMVPKLGQKFCAWHRVDPVAPAPVPVPKSDPWYTNRPRDSAGHWAKPDPVAPALVPEPATPEPPPPAPVPVAPVEQVSAEPVPTPQRKRTTPKYTSPAVAWHLLIMAAGKVTAQTGDKLNRTWQAIYNDDYPAARSSLQKVVTAHHLTIELP